MGRGMSLIERFMGTPDPIQPFGLMVANPAIEMPLSLQVLLNGRCEHDATALEQALRSLDPTLEKARVELTRLDEETTADNAGQVIGLAGWGPHVLKIVQFDTPLPAAVFEACVRPAHFAAQLKEDAQRHEAHVLLFYAGDADDALEQYTALATLAAAYSRLDALLVVNEIARAAFPAEALLATDPDVSMIDSLRQLPIPLLYGGFVKIEVEDFPGVWMRTFGNHSLGLQNLAYHAESHYEGNLCFDLFTNILMYARESRVQFVDGDTLKLDEENAFQFRVPTAEEWWLKSEGELLILERLAAGG
jgi:hypothetical protein